MRKIVTNFVPIVGKSYFRINEETFEEIILNAQKTIVDAFRPLIEAIKKIGEIEGLDLKGAEEDKKMLL